MIDDVPHYLDLDAELAKDEPRHKFCDPLWHTWREMHWREAYPASAGKVCETCKKVELRWF